MEYKRYALIRDSKGLTDAKVAKAAGFRQGVLSDWKAGRYTPKLDKLAKIAEALGVAPTELLAPVQVDMVVKAPDGSADSVITIEVNKADMAMYERMLQYYRGLNQANKKAVGELTRALAEAEDAKIAKISGIHGEGMAKAFNDLRSSKRKG